ncbi:type II toxin-antitoxin system VapC family toxin [Rhizobium sp. CB3090]|uniref:type II toxin-antitoxin system VapC family toxin n=1 Tax=Rhizobium sp. CB3090 TaxID=3039156 RepID=UPI0024B0F8CE|nr:type II toxin-antitoxin system VapC family toxin [Rhizobium sp. CB3090]WFU10977.1 type II toxin-antitoxin system VapC family toxin [Rhizobium sp. CB3090]
MKTRTIDTNILVRVLARDDSKQWQVAAEILRTSNVVILSTVLLETEWVLRKSIGMTSRQIAGLFRSLLALDTIVFREKERVVSALDAFEAGLDFADAFHVSSLDAGETFVTFDRDLVKLAQQHIDHVSIELAS